MEVMTCDAAEIKPPIDEEGNPAAGAGTWLENQRKVIDVFFFLPLNFSGCLIGKTGIAEVARPLKENTHVRHVDLSSNGLNEYGATEMAEVLRMSKSLRTLSLDGKSLLPL